MNESERSLKRVLNNESPVLFLGAGFTHGVYNSTGDKSPNGKQLKSMIINSYLGFSETEPEYKELSEYPLPQVAKYAANQKTKGEFVDYLCQIFSGLTPLRYHHLLFNYRWNRIYTTNIDDLIENLCKLKTVTPLIQNKKRKTHTRNAYDFEYIKLHGCVNNPDGGMVFSSDDYLDTMIESNDYRFNNFNIDIQNETFIFLGTEFEEVNLDYYLKLYEIAEFATRRCTPFFINPSPSIMLRQRIRDLKGILVEWDTETFLNYVSEITLKSTPSKSREIKLPGIFEHVKDIKLRVNKSESYNSNLYLGFHPEWEDIYFDWDFSTNALQRVKEALAKNNASKFIISLYGKAYSGKSCALFRIAVLLQNTGYDVFFHKSRTFDYYKIAQIINSSSQDDFAFIIDNASHYYFEIERFYNMIDSTKKIIIVTSSRTYFHIRKRYSLLRCNVKEIEVSGGIDDNEAKNIINKIKEKGYLGTLRDKTYKEQIQYIKKQKDIVSSLIGVTYGTGFKQRLRNDISMRFKDGGQSLDFLTLLCLIDKSDIPYFPDEMLSILFGYDAKNILEKVNDFIKPESNGYSLRTSFISGLLLTKDSVERQVQVLNKFFLSISSQITEERNDYWKIIYQSLCRVKFLIRILGVKPKKVREILFGLRDKYEHLSYYWLQFGLIEQEMGEYAKALNRFNQAKAIKPQSYQIEHAIGRNYCKQSRSYRDLDTAKGSFNQGKMILTKIIKDKEKYQARAFSIHCLIYETIAFYRKFDIDPSNEELKELANYLKVILDKDPNDVMAKSISYHFYRFMSEKNKLELFKFSFHDLHKYKGLFYKSDEDIEALLDESDL